MSYTFPGESNDIDVMLSDSPHSITVGEVTKPCFYDIRSEVGEEVGNAAGQVLEMEIASIKADHFPALAEGATVTIRQLIELLWQQQYTVLRILSNGSMKELFLQRTL
jgi:hypothetical protein